MRITKKYLTTLFLADPINATLLQKGFKPTTDHILAQLTSQHTLSIHKQQQIHRIGCRLLGLHATEDFTSK